MLNPRDILTLGVIGTLWIAVPASAEHRCTRVPETINAAVRVCEGPSTYRFWIAGSAEVYAREDYRRELLNLIEDWLSEHAPMWLDESPRAHVAVWAAVPEANPGATALRLVVELSVGDSIRRFVVFVERDPQTWGEDPLRVGILGSDTYPDSFGVSAGHISVQRAIGTTHEQLLAFLEGFEPLGIEDTGGGWYKVFVPIFAEAAFVQRIEDDAHHSYYVDGVFTNQILEWIADRGEVFYFGGRLGQ